MPNEANLPLAEAQSEQNSLPSPGRRGFLRRGGAGAVATAVAALGSAEIASAQQSPSVPASEANNPSFLPPYGKTAAEVAGLVSCAQWTGVPLRTILEYVGLKPSAKWIVAEGADGAAMTRSIPIEKCLDDVLLAFSQNGERLRPEQGYPLRLFAPGFEGNMSIKWLRRLHVTDQPGYTREETAKYTDLMADGRARKFSFVMECKSLITSPSGTQKLTRKGTHEMRGIAWSGRGKITHVDVSIDGGDNWKPAALDAPILSKALTSFRAPFEWHGEELMLMSRAVDETGYVQPMLSQLIDARGKVSFYHNNAIQPWRVEQAIMRFCCDAETSASPVITLRSCHARLVSDTPRPARCCE